MKRNGKGSFKGRKIAADSDDDNDDFSISDDDSEINSDSNNSDSDTGDESDHEGNFSASHALGTNGTSFNSTFMSRQWEDSKYFTSTIPLVIALWGEEKALAITEKEQTVISISCVILGQSTSGMNPT